MKFAVLSGAYKNAGDYLIVDRCISLLKYVFPGCETVIYERRKSLQPYLEEINECDALILAGGPAYQPEIYPKQIPLCENLDDIKTKIIAVGLGWYGNFGIDGFNSTIYDNYRYSRKTMELLERISKDSALTCRDLLTVRSLKNNGFENVLMTGCPAWYDIENVTRTTLREDINFPYKKICISDPGSVCNTNSAYEVTEFIKNKYPQAEINFVFHRGIHKDDMTSENMAKAYEHLKEKLQKLGVNVIDISYGAEGFKIYDDCDLHVGFRVHAHIYNLSKRNISVLIEEDGRGAGQNEALGLFHIKTMEDRGEIPYMKYGVIGKLVRWLAFRFEITGKENRYLIKNLDDNLYLLEKGGYMMMENAFHIQKRYFDVMVNYLKETVNLTKTEQYQ